MTKELIEIDGAFGEGGGSILRLACAFSVLTKKAVRVFNIRKRRPKPGLKMQHLVGLQTLAEISRGNLENGKIGATEILFYPGKVVQGTYSVKISTAGSVGLILQVLQLACIYGTGPITLNIEGGATFGLWAPTIPYLEHITTTMLTRMGYKIAIEVSRHGFYPKGGARVQFKITPTKRLHPIKLEEFGEITEVNGLSIASFQLKNRNVANRQAKVARQVIKKYMGINAVIDSRYVDALNPGSGICLWLKTDAGAILGADVIGEKGKPAEQIGTECAKYLSKTAQKKATADRFFADQIIPFMALAKGVSIIQPYEITKHTKTNIWLVEQFLNKKFSITPKDSLYEIKIENANH
ncbi:MAG: RNA 3'-terminal phosphate cyclase [Candidatus Helarchaeota archaeon]